MKPSGSVIEGSLVAAFEREVAELVGGRTCVAVDEGRSALALALSALGVARGDEVVVPSYAPVGAADAIRLVGAVPVFADIDPVSYCLDPEAVAAVLSPRTVAVVAAHQFGHPAAMRELGALADRHGVALLEYASRAYGAALDGRLVGTFGLMAVFGFGVATQDAALARRLRGLRTGDAVPAEESAAVARGELERVAGFTARRRANARVFDSALTGVLPPYAAEGTRHVYQRYVVRVPGNGRPDRDAFAKALAARGVDASVPVATPVHRLPAYRSGAHLPHTERAAAATLSLPVHPMLTEREVERVVQACNALGGLLG
ncbi:DegT/DnrJ/EryC1/StrS family aminotransferase [Streptantibioticus parmotrematis]|uniref:DegT/DnrJ/EryC1/StrS family aminotransferase n=1 Tax=Streptantibioticus parmotrematis TaxID=2873249 RepID=UPI0033DB2B91